ncbi:MAG: TonB-dependent receptor [Betaproteobacteria bacterium]|nr:MAG: TonB-dependent receptor [Betaproteobacteria bacterium]
MLRLIAGFLAGSCICLCYAQDDTIVITATRFPDSKRDLPVGVTVITADDIRKSASSNLGDILAQFGLLQIRDLAGTQNPQVDLRGFGITGDQNTLVLLDGLRLTESDLESAQLSAIPLESIERIEIVRGGGAVPYGAGATGGTINIITRRGRPGELRAHALARAGGFGTEEARGGFSRQGETFGGSLAASYEDTEGYRRNSRYRQRNAIGRLDAELPNGRAYLKVGVDEQRQRLPGALTEAQINADPRQTRTPDDWRERDGAHLALGGTHNIGRYEVSADLGYRQRTTKAFFAAFGGFFTDTDANLWSFTPRAKLAFDALGRKHDLIVGADFERWDYDTLSASGPASTGAPFSRRQGEQDSVGWYAQTNFWVAPRTRVVLGGRTQRMAQRLTEEVFPVDDRRTADRLEAYEAALRHSLGTGWSVYAKYGKSFRVANFDENACFFPPCAPILLKPQTALGSELGFEYENARLRLRTSVHEIRLDNEIYFSPLTFSNINLSPTERRGLELEALWQTTPSLDLRAGLAFQQARFRSGVYGGVDVSGKTVPVVPEVLATAGASWSFAPRSRANLNVRHVGRQRFDNDQANTFPRQQPEYTLADAKLEHRLAPRWELALEVRNLFDKRYFSYGTATGATSFSALPAPGRAAYASVAWRLD